MKEIEFLMEKTGVKGEIVVLLDGGVSFEKLDNFLKEVRKMKGERVEAKAIKKGSVVVHC